MSVSHNKNNVLTKTVDFKLNFYLKLWSVFRLSVLLKLLVLKFFYSLSASEVNMEILNFQDKEFY